MRLQDLHTHTDYSDGKSDVRLMAQTAGLYGLDTIAITDHCSEQFPFAAPRIAHDCEEARQWAACHVMAGVEAVATDIDGRLSVTGEMLPYLDIVLCEMNRNTKGCFETENTDARAENIIRTLVNACRRNLRIRVLAHPLNVAAITGVDLDQFTEPLLNELAKACRETNVAFEIMSDLWWWFRTQPLDAVMEKYARIVGTMAAKGVEITLSSDAHSHQGVGNFIWARQVMAKAGITDDRIAYIEPPKETPRL
jgi:histidinol phosphatase-like PHP family hydrolase